MAEQFILCTSWWVLEFELHAAHLDLGGNLNPFACCDPGLLHTHHAHCLWRPTCPSCLEYGHLYNDYHLLQNLKLLGHAMSDCMRSCSAYLCFYLDACHKEPPRSWKGPRSITNTLSHPLP